MAGNKRWTAGEIILLQDKYGKISISELSTKICRSIPSIQKKASDLGIEFNPNGIADLNTRLTRIENDLKTILKILNNGKHQKRARST